MASLPEDHRLHSLGVVEIVEHYWSAVAGGANLEGSIAEQVAQKLTVDGIALDLDQGDFVDRV